MKNAGLILYIIKSVFKYIVSDKNIVFLVCERARKYIYIYKRKSLGIGTVPGEKRITRDNRFQWYINTHMTHQL